MFLGGLFRSVDAESMLCRSLPVCLLAECGSHILVICTMYVCSVGLPITEHNNTETNKEMLIIH